ncbi:MAG: hypothetical protein U0Q12_14695 [Vicinamibacterales bacterium]
MTSSDAPREIGQFDESALPHDWLDAQATWSADGREIFFVKEAGADDLALWAAPFATNPTMHVGEAHRLFGGIRRTSNRSYDPMPDGKRFVIIANEPDEDANTITVILNWPAALKGSPVR